MPGSNVVRVSASLVLGFLLTCFWLNVEDPAIVAWSNTIIWGYIFAVLLLFPPVWFGVLACLSVTLTLVLAYVNEIKISLTQIPLTYIDLEIVFNSPRDFFDVMKFPGWIYILCLAAVIVLVILAVGILMRTAYKLFILSLPEKYALLYRSTIMVGAGGLMLLGEILFLARFTEAVGEDSSLLNNAWRPSGVAALSQELGIVPFILYSATVERRGRRNFMFINNDFGTPATTEQIHAAVARYVHLEHLPEQKLPNIVLLHLEGTFNLNLAFDLRSHVQSPIFDSTPTTLAYGQLRVNPVGGGSWMSEFEVVTGLDSRLFGSSGYYTHSSVAPYIRNTLASHLSAKGYETSVYYPVSGDFYNARTAYGLYRFQSFYDASDLGLGRGWGASDPEIAESFIRSSTYRKDAPFFSYVLFGENHGPHQCKNYSDESHFEARLADTDNFEVNCEVNEYVRILKSTAEAVRKIEDYLQEVEEATGRPYLLFMYGDHQPHTFTNTGGAAHDYGDFRSGDTIRQTIYKINGSVKNRLSLSDETLPLILLPSIISSFTASTPEKIYLGVNFYLYDNCGSDPLGGEPRSSGIYLRAERHPVISSNQECSVALEQTLEAYRRSGVLGLQ